MVDRQYHGMPIEEREGEGMTYEEYRKKRDSVNRRKTHMKMKTRLDLGAKKYYTPSKRKYANPTVKYRLTERFGDKTEREEVNIRQPFVKLADPVTRQNMLLPDGKTRTQGWYAIRKLWMTIRISNSQGDTARKEHALRALRWEQYNLGIKLTESPEFELAGTERLSYKEKEYWKWYDEQNGTSYSGVNQ